MDDQQPQPVTSAVDQLRQQNQQVRGKFQGEQDAATQYYLQNQQSSQNSTGAISQALSTLGDKSTAGQVGKAIQTPNYAGYCLQYVDDKTGNTNRQPTAIADYQVRAKNGQIQTSDKIPEGARVYFAPDQTNGNIGHVGLADGKGNFTSATDNGVKTFSLKDWSSLTGQKFIGWSK